MSTHSFTALVVDDDSIVRRTVAFALEQEGFICELAVDGADALTNLAAREFDLVVTDLSMPNKHGHALSVELLARQSTPVLVVHSSIDDPRLAKDLLTRGVDDIVYKPTNYASFAAKMKALVNRRNKERPQPTASELAHCDAKNSQQAYSSAVGREGLPVSISLAAYEQQLDRVWHLLPLSQAAIDVFELVRKDDTDALSIAAGIQLDAALTGEMLRLANSSFYNPSCRKITDVYEAVTRIGMRRVGELAVAMSALGVLTDAALPWLDRELAWQRSLAGGIAASRILETMGQAAQNDGLALSAVMYPLGRLVLGTLFPTEYRAMLAVAQRDRLALRQLERQVFPESHSAATARVLARWNIPAEVHAPLALASEEFSFLPRISEPLRTQVSVVKAAIAVGQLAVGRWLPWDLVDFPSTIVLRKAGIQNVAELVQQVRGDLAALRLPSGVKETSEEPRPNAVPQRSHEVAYRNLSPEPFDFMAALLPVIGFIPRSLTDDERGFDEISLINCLHVPAPQIVAGTRNSGYANSVLIVDEYLPEPITHGAVVVRLPASIAALRTACESVAASIGAGAHASSSSGILEDAIVPARIPSFGVSV